MWIFLPFLTLPSLHWLGVKKTPVSTKNATRLMHEFYKGFV